MTEAHQEKEANPVEEKRNDKWGEEDKVVAQEVDVPGVHVHLGVVERREGEEGEPGERAVRQVGVVDRGRLRRGVAPIVQVGVQLFGWNKVGKRYDNCKYSHQ